MGCSAESLRAWVALSPTLPTSRQHVPPMRLLLAVPFPKTNSVGKGSAKSAGLFFYHRVQVAA